MHRIALGLLFTSSLLACVDAPDLGETPSALGPGSGDRENGRYVLGGLADGFTGMTGEHLTGSLTGVVVGTTPISLAVIESTSIGPCLSVNGATCAASNPVGAILKGGNGLFTRLKIEAVVTFSTADSLAMRGYVIKHNAAWASGGAPIWVSYCVDDRLAYPIAGRVRLDGSFSPDATVTFACSEYTTAGVRPTAAADLVGNGIAAKVQSWGFLRGVSSLSNSAGITIAGEQLFQIATRATRADYCRDGVAHSIDATRINITDLIATNLTRDPVGDLEPSPTDTTAPIEPTSSHMQLEAIWNGKVPLCLSKLRWQALPIGDRCAGSSVVRDPRLPGTLSQQGEVIVYTPHGVYCEDYNSLADAATDGAMIVMQSAWNDVGLWRWKHPTTGDSYATTVGRYSGAHLGGHTPPAAGYNVATTPVHLGTLLTSTGFAALSAAYPADAGTTVMLRSCKNGNDWATATATTMPGGYTNCKNEGLVWTTLPASTVSSALGWDYDTLTLFERDGVTTEYLTTTSTSVLGYHVVATLGSLLRAPTW